MEYVSGIIEMRRIAINGGNCFEWIRRVIRHEIEYFFIVGES